MTLTQHPQLVSNYNICGTLIHCLYLYLKQTLLLCLRSVDKVTNVISTCIKLRTVMFKQTITFDRFLQ